MHFNLIYKLIRKNNNNEIIPILFAFVMVFIIRNIFIYKSIFNALHL